MTFFLVYDIINYDTIREIVFEITCAFGVLSVSVSWIVACWTYNNMNPLGPDKFPSFIIRPTKLSYLCCVLGLPHFVFVA